MEPTSDFTELIVWQKAYQFTLSVYALTKYFPKEEMYGLTSQFRRAAVSVSANIAEGYKRRGKRDKIRFFNYAQSSLQECRCYIFLARDLHFRTDPNMDRQMDEVGKLLTSYIKGMERNS